MPPGLTLSNIRYVLKVKWINPGKGVAPSPTPWCSSYWKGSLLVALDYGRQLYFLQLIIYPGLDIGMMVTMFANGPGHRGSIPDRVISETLKIVLDASLLNTQQYKVRIKGKVDQSWERSSALPYTSV